MDPDENAFTYHCFSCKIPDKFLHKAVIKCEQCGYRVFYKPRSSKPTQYEAI